MTAVVPLYSQEVADLADSKDLVLVVDTGTPLGTLVTIHPEGRPDVVFGSAWQLEPDGPWRAGQSFGEMPDGKFSGADEAITFALSGGPLTQRVGYLLGRKTTRR